MAYAFIDDVELFFKGFGPFGCHTINASWIAVQELERLGLDKNVNLVIKEIPVIYDDVKKIVPLLWKQYKPKVRIYKTRYVSMVYKCLPHL